MPLLCSCSPRLTRTCELYHRTGRSILLRRYPMVPVSNGPISRTSPRRHSAARLRLPIIRRISRRVLCLEIAARSQSSRDPSPFECIGPECGPRWGNVPRSICEECFSPREVTYDRAAQKSTITREHIAAGPNNIWRYAGLLPLAADYQPSLPVGGTPLLPAPRLAANWGLHHLYLKNDAVCFPSLSFKDRVVAMPLAAARRFGFHGASCSSTANLANAVAAQAVRQGFEAWVFIPADLEPAKAIATQVYGARVVRIAGNYDQVNRLCSQIADQHRWGFVNVNLRPYYAAGSKTVAFEIAEQLCWRLPDN